MPFISKEVPYSLVHVAFEQFFDAPIKQLRSTQVIDGFNELLGVLWSRFCDDLLLSFPVHPKRRKLAKIIDNIINAFRMFVFIIHQDLFLLKELHGTNGWMQEDGFEPPKALSHQISQATTNDFSFSPAFFFSSGKEKGRLSLAHLTALLLLLFRRIM